MADEKRAPVVVDLSEIDMGSLDSSELSMAADAVHPDIAAVFPDPLPAAEASQDFFAANDPKKKEPKQKESKEKESKEDDEGAKGGLGRLSAAADERDRRADAMPQQTDGQVPLSKKKKRKVGSKGKSAAAVNAVAAAEAASAKRTELREKLRNRMAMQHELGGKAKMLNQMGVTLDEIGQAAKDEASGKPVSNSKQDRVLDRAKSMFASTFKGMDAKQRNYLSRKTDEVSGMATDLMRKMLAGPGKDPASEPKPATKKGKGKKAKGKNAKDDGKGGEEKGTGKDARRSAVEAAAFGEENRELDTSLDPRLDDLVRAVNQKQPKRPKTTSAPAAERDDAPALPIRPRVRHSTTNKQTPNEQTQNEGSEAKGGGELSKSQLKNRRKRQKLKEKLKQLKPDPKADPKPDPVPLLVPA